jgi:hypothetical protein
VSAPKVVCAGSTGRSGPLFPCKVFLYHIKNLLEKPEDIDVVEQSSLRKDAILKLGSPGLESQSLATISRAYPKITIHFFCDIDVNAVLRIHLHRLASV